MPAPPLSTVTGEFFDPAGQPLDGQVEFQLTGWLRSSTNNYVVGPHPVTVAIDNGTISVGLVSNQRADLVAHTVRYRVTQTVEGQPADTYLIDVPTAGGDLADLRSG